FKERYAMRSGIESTNSGLKNRLGLGRLRVRGRGSVFRVIWHKLAGWNVLRAAASKKLGMVQRQVTAQGWLGSTPEGRRPQIRGWPSHYPEPKQRECPRSLS